MHEISSQCHSWGFPQTDKMRKWIWTHRLVHLALWVLSRVWKLKRVEAEAPKPLWATPVRLFSNPRRSVDRPCPHFRQPCCCCLTCQMRTVKWAAVRQPLQTVVWACPGGSILLLLLLFLCSDSLELDNQSDWSLPSADSDTNSHCHYLSCQSSDEFKLLPWCVINVLLFFGTSVGTWLVENTITGCRRGFWKHEKGDKASSAERH